MWFWFSIIALICWSGSDLFSKIGCRGQNDKLSHLKMVTAVGVVMGLHAAYEIFIGGVEKAVVAFQIEHRLLRLQLRLLQAEAVCVYLMEKVLKTLLNTGSQAVYVPGNQSHGNTSL